MRPGSSFASDWMTCRPRSGVPASMWISVGLPGWGQWCDSCMNDSSLDAGNRLGQETAILAGRLAELLTTSPVAREGALADGAAFLSAMADSATTERPPPGAAHPLVRLASGLR